MRYAILLLLLLVACTTTSGNGFSNTGSNGVTLEFTKGFPDAETYEQQPLPISLEVKNEGTYSVSPRRLLLSWSYNPLYLTNTAGNDVKFPLSYIFEGRSEYYPQGDLFHVEEFGFQTNKIVGQREAPETDLHALVCYEYATRLVEGICLDVDSYLKTGRPQVCTGQDLIASSQGAPVAFTKVEIRMRPLQTGSDFPAVSPEFIVTLRNVGGGTVLSPPLQDFAAACRLDVDAALLNGVVVRGRLLGFDLECQPAVVKFRDREARVRCSFAADSFNRERTDLLGNIINDGSFNILGDDCSRNYAEMNPSQKYACISEIMPPPMNEIPSLKGLLGLSLDDCYGSQNLGSALYGDTGFDITGPKDTTSFFFNNPQPQGLSAAKARELQEAEWGACPSFDKNPLMIPNNIMTVLALEARYIYRDSVTHELTIHRNEFGATNAFTGDAPIQKGYAYDTNGNILRNPDNSLMTKCNQFVGNASKAPDQMIALNPEFSCACRRNECVEMDDFGFCAHGLCPGNFECCDKAAYESFKKATSNKGQMGEPE